MEFKYKQVAQAGPGDSSGGLSAPRKEIRPRELRLREAVLLSTVTQLWGSG